MPQYKENKFLWAKLKRYFGATLSSILLSHFLFGGSVEKATISYYSAPAATSLDPERRMSQQCAKF